MRSLPLLFLLALSLYLAYSYLSLSSQLEALHAEVERLEGALDARGKALGQLNASLKACEENLSMLEGERAALEEALQGCRAKASLLEAMLNESEAERKATEQELLELLSQVEEVRQALYRDIEWFKENAFADAHLSILERYCMDGETLNVACLTFYIRQEWGVSYREEEGDRLKAVEETLEEGGDCEDFTLLINAYIRSLEPETLLLWERGRGTFPLYEKGNKEYYLDGAKPVKVPYRGVVGVCYLTEREGLNLYGHCLSAVADGLSSLDNAPLFEPQSGRYMGSVGEEIGLCKDGQKGCEDEMGNIFIVFTSDNFYIFSEGKWKSLKGLYGMLRRYG